jgi:defect-in-organelle-trafficking protein DotD
VFKSGGSLHLIPDKNSMMYNCIYKKLSVFLGLGVMALALNACSSPIYAAKNPQVVATPDKVSMMLADAADRSSNALQTLAAIEQQRTPAVAMAPIHNAPPELMRAITISWVGPIEPILKTLADRASYGFKIVGQAPPVASVVTLNVENKPVIEVLQNLGLQLGVRANVNVDAVNRVVELQYASQYGYGE